MFSAFITTNDHNQPQTNAMQNSLTEECNIYVTTHTNNLCTQFETIGITVKLSVPSTIFVENASTEDGRLIYILNSAAGFIDPLVKLWSQLA